MHDALFMLTPTRSGQMVQARQLADQVAGKILRRQAERLGDRIFVRSGEAAVGYAEANRRANRVANALLALGVRKGDRVGILLRNCVEYLDLWFGLSKIGAIQVPINTEYKAAQALAVLSRAPVPFLVVHASLAPALFASGEGAPATANVLVLGEAAAAVSLPGRRVLDYAQCVGRAPADEPQATDTSGADVSAIMNTSGTTGPSKGVLVSHAQQFILGRNIAADLELTADDTYYNFFPLFHNTAQAMITLPVLLAGAQMVLIEKFSATRFWDDVRRYGCTAFYYIGEILRILLRSTRREDAAGSTLRVGWGIGASPGDFAEFTERFEVPLRTGYGSTEANVPVFYPHAGAKPGSVGRVIPGFELRIADERGVALPAGQSGEILVRSTEPYATMLGYDANPEATVAAWQDLWFHTGDAGHLDEAGNLFFIGRVRDVMRVRGENVSAFELETVIASFEGVLEVAAIGVPGELGGDDIKVVVVPQPGASIDFEKLVAHAEAHLPRYAVPRYLECVKELPKTETNKVRKHVLRATPFTESTWDRLKSRKPAR
jgi:crotonobetaine/carnitine-CoA ligase